ncbi:MAG: DNA primase [Verrucomicrobiia bacterium]
MPGLIADHILEQIRQNNDIVEVIGSYFPLKRAGANFRALCPFHKEKTPSFNVNPQKQIWHCFGCGAGGDVFTFVMKYENLDFISAVRRLAERTGVRLEFEETASEPNRDQKELLFKLHEQVAEFFHQTLLKGKSAEPARAYLKKRGITADVVKRWRLGYSPDAWDALIQWAASRKFSAELLETAGLALRRERGDGFYDRFRGRLMFPICDEQGRVVAFSGRILTDAKDQPKYVNSPETPIFQKGKILFALDKAKRAILDERFAIVCEGQVDTISCHEAGMTNVVAPQGTALTEQHARILKRYAEEVVLMFDADAAGQNAVVRSAEPLWEAGLVIRVAVLPRGHDPDSFVKEMGAEKLKNLITKAPSFFVYLLERLSEQHDPRSDSGKLQIARHLADWLVRTPSPILRSTYAQQTAVRLAVPEDAVWQEVRRLQAGRRIERPSNDSECAATDSSPAKTERPSPLLAETLLLRLMLTDERIVDVVVARLDRAWLIQNVPGKLIGHILDLRIGKCWHGADAVLGQISDDEERRFWVELMMLPQPKATGVQAAINCLAALEKRALERQLRELCTQLAHPELTESAMVTLKQQILDLRRKLDHIARPSMDKTKLVSHS